MDKRQTKGLTGRELHRSIARSPSRTRIDLRVAVERLDAAINTELRTKHRRPHDEEDRVSRTDVNIGRR